MEKEVHPCILCGLVVAKNKLMFQLELLDEQMVHGLQIVLGWNPFFNLTSPIQICKYPCYSSHYEWLLFAIDKGGKRKKQH